uniref:Uncharacterized protein n=1 Tax=Megaselia scalaris TaxID=36166 RepID=T1H386_MEGSC
MALKNKIHRKYSNHVLAAMATRAIAIVVLALIAIVAAKPEPLVYSSPYVASPYVAALHMLHHMLQVTLLTVLPTLPLTQPTLPH